MTHDEQRRADEALGRAIRELTHQADRAEVEVIIGYETGAWSVTADDYPIAGEAAPRFVETLSRDDLADACDTVADRLAREDWA